MGYISKSRANILATVLAVTVLAAIAGWQFYLFIVFKDSRGVLDTQGGIHHLWWAIGATLVACVAGFLGFSVFLRNDKKEELHITSAH